MTLTQEHPTMSDATELAEREALAPCPFCDGQAKLLHGSPGCWFVSCNSCSAASNDGDREAVIAAWNRRTTPAAAPETVERVAHFADRLGDQVVCIADAQITAGDLRALTATQAHPGWNEAIEALAPIARYAAAYEKVRTKDWTAEDGSEARIPDNWLILERVDQSANAPAIRFGDLRRALEAYRSLSRDAATAGERA